ncbi:DMT family transporter [Aminipila terrae]|uniref:EamA family transporter n=1 Tax=Aminipila terrae TaxID=2697030 RepID=A0A6P1MGR0_9FIRM|nr:DMT family transporter [Aminipila terrae]QHI72931.1 EamA family transporter [Aminipila terrae]
MTSQLKADLMLLLVVSCWGFSFYLTDISCATLDTFTLNAFRFIIAFAVAVLLAFPKLRSISVQTLSYSLLLGLILSIMYATMTFGIKNTVLSNSGFLCGLTVIFTPLLSCFIYRKPPEKKLMLVAGMCVLGIALLTLTNGFQINQENLKGDLLCILCGLFYAIDLIITEKAVSYQEVNAFQLGVLQLGITGGISLILAFLLESPHLPPTPKIWVAVLFLAIFCTGVAFIVQAIAQQYTSATHVGVINSLEPVFAGIVAYFFAGDILSPKSYLGAALMVTGLIIMEINFSDFHLMYKKIIKIKEELKNDPK